MNLTDQQIRAMIMDIFNRADYDLWKFYNPKTSEDPETAEQYMENLVTITKEFLEKNES